MKFLVILFGILAAANAVSFFELVQEEWKSYKVIADFISLFLIWTFGTFINFN